MLVLIVENEPKLATHLKELIQNAMPHATFLPGAGSVRETLLLLKSQTPDLVFMDIELADGNAFSIFRETTVKAPVIFTTGFNQYYMNAFENNGVDYLLKPISQEKVSHSIQNYHFKKDLFISSALHEILSRISEPSQKAFRQHFLVKQGQKLIPVRSCEINHFYSERTLIYLVTRDKRKFVINESLSELELQLNPEEFFRLNRKYLVSKSSIVSLDTHVRGQVSVHVHLLEEERIIVSRQQTPVIKEWLVR